MAEHGIEAVDIVKGVVGVTFEVVLNDVNGGLDPVGGTDSHLERSKEISKERRREEAKTVEGGKAHKDLGQSDGSDSVVLFPRGYETA